MMIHQKRAIAIDSVGSKWFGTNTGVGILYGLGGYPVTENPRWLDATHFQSTYDINAFISRGIYAVLVQGAVGNDQLEISSNDAYTFTIDYIGDPDTSYPPAPTVRACASQTTTTLSASWTVPSTVTIGLYRYAIGTAPGLSDVTNWITTTLTTNQRSNLNLLPGEMYYFSVRARNTGGIWSQAGTSNSVVAGAGGCPQVDFSAAPLAGMSPLTVSFTAQITSTTTAWLWRFGDGSESDLLTPNYIYWTPGVYTVTLDVFGPGGWTTVIKPDLISVASDTVPPAGTLTINEGAPYVTTTQVTLALPATDPSGLADMRFSNNGVSWSSWETYAAVKAWSLLFGDGPKTVYAQVRDVPGNVAAFSDGINDAPSLHSADVGISVANAVDVAKQAADLVLLQQDLNVLRDGIVQGRKTFANTLKYVFMATSANFGNMFSMAGASLFLSYLPMLPKQILLINFLTDLPETTIASDRVDDAMVVQPRRMDIAFISRFMLIFGPLSSLFDFATFAVLIWLMKADQQSFQTGWFIESILSAGLVVFAVRTRLPFRSSRPSRMMLGATLAVAAIALALPYTPLASLLGFVPLKPLYLLTIFRIVAAYFTAAELAKRWFYRKYGA